MRKESAQTTLGAAISLSVLVLIYLPIQLYAGNAQFLNFTGADHLALFGASTAGLILFLLLIYFVLLGTGIRTLYSRLLLALALYAWLHSFLLTGDHGQLDGTALDLSISVQDVLAEIALIVFAISAVVLADRKDHVRMLAGFLVVVAAINILVSGLTLWSTSRNVNVSDHSRATVGQHAVFSDEMNIMVLVLDGLQSDVFEEIVNQDPELLNSFSGFTYYPDTMGVANSTDPSIPAIHSGNIYTGNGNFKNYFTHSIETASISNTVSDAGYATRELNPVAGVCAQKLDRCDRALDMVDSRLYFSRHESLLLLDMSLFRVSPAWIRPHVYSDGNWFLLQEFAWFFEIDFMAKDVFNSYQTLQKINELITFDSDLPVFSFIRLLTTHDPFMMNGNCLFERRERNRAAVLDQSRCALQAVSKFVAAHRDSGGWDNSLFIITADHGLPNNLNGLPPLDEAGLPSTRAVDSDIGELHAQVRAANANPVLAIHFPGNNGVLETSLYPAQLSDIAATICGFLDDCDWDQGIDLSGQPTRRPAEKRTRQFINRTSDTEFELFQVTGPIWEAQSWQRVR